jgi:hypothetical protein
MGATHSVGLPGGKRDIADGSTSIVGILTHAAYCPPAACRTCSMGKIAPFAWTYCSDHAQNLSEAALSVREPPADGLPALFRSISARAS